ncbi:cysteine-rich CWC family protein [Vibrio fluvialis]|nr:cysteine-rich CWC family protein [Vibrio fluvialis]EKO3460183.1 cysteine-rich CWC family protein [Vibrio fluvialis]EMA2480628.1 cysteine-rich CWC family protein [Vibrio fluvialis]
MSHKVQNVDPLICPLCGNGNACVNLSTGDVTKSCWCNDPNITFSQELLDRVPKDAKRKACICKTCALKFQHEKAQGVQFYQPE